MKFGTKLRVLGDYGTVLYSSSSVPIQVSFSCIVVDFPSEFFVSDAAERISCELVSGWFCIKNCASYVISITDFLNEILSKDTWSL